MGIKSSGGREKHGCVRWWDKRANANVTDVEMRLRASPCGAPSNQPEKNRVKTARNEEGLANERNLGRSFLFNASPALRTPAIDLCSPQNSSWPWERGSCRAAGRGHGGIGRSRKTYRPSDPGRGISCLAPSNGVSCAITTEHHSAMWDDSRVPANPDADDSGSVGWLVVGRERHTAACVGNFQLLSGFVGGKLRLRRRAEAPRRARRDATARAPERPRPGCRDLNPH